MIKRLFITLLVTTIVTGSFYLMAQGQSSKKEMVKTSTTDTPKVKIPVVTITIPQHELFRILDTSDMIMRDYGLELTGSQIRGNQAVMNRQWDRLLNRYGRLDTIKMPVKGGKP